MVSVTEAERRIGARIDAVLPPDATGEAIVGGRQVSLLFAGTGLHAPDVLRWVAREAAVMAADHELGRDVRAVVRGALATAFLLGFEMGRSK